MDAYPNLNTLYLSPRLQARLADAAGYPVTTIVAPTGYGKTTAAQYLQRRIAAEAPDARVFRQFLSGGGYLGLMSRMILVEALITLPAVIVVVPVYRLIHDRCASDY